MNVLSSPGISDYQSRTVTIEVTGVRQQSVLKTGSYQVRVPYSQMSQMMQSIHRRGGTVKSVQLMGEAPVTAENLAAPDTSNAPESSQQKENASEAKKASKHKRK